jgi:hypothetical protein
MRFCCRPKDARHHFKESQLLNEMANQGGVVDKKNVRLLMDSRGVQEIIDGFPQGNAFRTLDEIAAWLEALAASSNFPAERLADVGRQLDEAAAPHLQRLSGQYLLTPRLSRGEEKRLWLINAGHWKRLSSVYERSLDGLTAKAASTDAAQHLLPALCARLLAALRAVIKWEQFHYGLPEKVLWQRLGHTLLLAKEHGVEERLVNLGGVFGETTPAREYEKAMVFQLASMNSLLPPEIEVAERFIDHFLSKFEFSPTAQHDSVYWSDLRDSQPPQRLEKILPAASKTQQFFKPAAAHPEMLALLRQLEQGEQLPAQIKLGGETQPRVLIPVLAHLCTYLAQNPPTRQHDRHRVKHRISVLNGLINAFVAFSKEFGGRPMGLPIESWVVEDVSRGGFGAVLSDIPGEWLKVGALLAIQPEGGDNWLLGSVRRYQRESHGDARVGIETLARIVEAVELIPKMASSYAAALGVPSLLLLEGNAPRELRAILPPNMFDPGESFGYVSEGRNIILEPISLIERTPDYDLARYRLTGTA